MCKNQERQFSQMMVKLLPPDGFMQCFMSAVFKFMACSIILKQ